MNLIDAPEGARVIFEVTAKLVMPCPGTPLGLVAEAGNHVILYDYGQIRRINSPAHPSYIDPQPETVEELWRKGG